MAKIRVKDIFEFVLRFSVVIGIFYLGYLAYSNGHHEDEIVAEKTVESQELPK